MMLCCLPGCKEAEKSYASGRAAFASENYEAAFEKYRLAISQGFDEPYLYADLALACQKLGKTTEALETLNKAYAASPEDPLVLKRIGRFYEEEGDYQMALDYYEKSLSSPEDAMSVEDLETVGYAARIEAIVGNFEEAVRLYNILITQNYYPLAHDILAGECYLKMNQQNAACQYFDMVALQENVRPEHYLAICRMLKEYGGTEAYETYFAKGLSLCNAENVMSEGEYYADAGRFSEAIDRFSGADTPGALIAKAECHAAFGEYEAAEDIYRDLLEKEIEVDAVCNQYMILKVRENSFMEASQLLTNVLSSKDDAIAADGAWNQVVLYEMTGDYAKAFESLQMYLTKYPSNAAVKREYAFLSRIAD